MPTHRSLLFSFLILLFEQAPLYALAPQLEEIRIEGNKKTVDSVIYNLSELKEGEEVTAKMLENARKRVLSSGLFEKVTFSKKVSEDGSQISLSIKVVEKLSWFVAPIFKVSEDSLAGGFVAGESNLFGFNKRAGMLGDYGPSQKRFVFVYRDPSLLGSKFTLAWDSLIRSERMIEYAKRKEIRRVQLLAYGATILPGYKWSDRFTSSMGFYFRFVDEELKSQSESRNPNREALREDGVDYAFLVKFTYDNTVSEEGYFRGAKLSFESSLSDNRIYSDFSYIRQELRFKSGIIFGEEQFNWQNSLSLQMGKDLPFYRELMSGGTNLRGYIHRQFRGDTKISSTQEFHFPVHDFNRFIIRALFFYDSDLIYFQEFQDASFDTWRNGVGGGLRFYLKGVVVPLIGLDVGWGIEDKTYSAYLNIGGGF